MATALSARSLQFRQAPLNFSGALENRLGEPLQTTGQGGIPNAAGKHQQPCRFGLDVSDSFPNFFKPRLSSAHARPTCCSAPTQEAVGPGTGVDPIIRIVPGRGALMSKEMPASAEA
jgi:hypothetical protein